MPSLAGELLVKNELKKLDFSRDGHVYVERYTVSELTNIAKLMKSKRGKRLYAIDSTAGRRYGIMLGRD